MSDTNGFELSREARRAIFERGGTREQRQLMDRLWDGLKQRFPDADCRQQQRFVGLYLNENTDATFARINSKTSGPVIGIQSLVVNAYNPVSLQSQGFPEWGGDPKGFVLEKSSICELLELLDLAYRHRKSGASVLGKFRQHKQDQEKRSKGDVEALIDQEPSIEGAKATHTSIVAERNPKLRTAAIRIHGLECKACGFDFNSCYGERGVGFIEVHHKNPFGESPGLRETNPKSDLTVLCANCHRMVHRRRGSVLTVEELRQIIDENQE